MNIERFQKMLEAYGTREENWPSRERQVAQLYLQNNDDGQRLLEEYRELDIQLDGYLPRHSPAIRDNILENLQASPLDSFISWLIPEYRSDFWRPLLAGALPLVIGIVIGTSAWVSVPDLYSTDSTDNWETEDAYFLALDESQISLGLIND